MAYKNAGQWTNGEEIVCNTNTLTMPHPRMQERDFVMIPLREVEAILNSPITKH
jgi:7,8-dihydro-6-hydroxymethylpterin-pyrophosphokinase